MKYLFTHCYQYTGQVIDYILYNKFVIEICNVSKITFGYIPRITTPSNNGNNNINSLRLRSFVTFKC